MAWPPYPVVLQTAETPLVSLRQGELEDLFNDGRLWSCNTTLAADPKIKLSFCIINC